MKDLIRQILKEQITASEFCTPVKGWEGTLNNIQDFTACRSTCVEYDVDDSEKCIKWDKCGRQHNAIDFAVPSGTEVYAPNDGKVTSSYITGDGCGGMIIIDHGDGIKTKYCHLKKRDVSKNTDVVKGELIGLVGGDSNDVGRGNSDSAHLHYQVRKDNKPIDPVANGYVNNEVCGETISVVNNIKDRVDPDIVREIQGYLVMTGYLEEGEYVYGIMDTDTVVAIKNLQDHHDITQDGKINKETVQALMIDLSELNQD